MSSQGDNLVQVAQKAVIGSAVSALTIKLMGPLLKTGSQIYERVIGKQALERYLTTGQGSALWSPPTWAIRLRRYTEQTTQLASTGIDAVCMTTGLGAGLTTGRHLAERYELEPAKAIALQTSGAVLGTSAGYVIKEPIKQRALPALRNWIAYPWRH